MILFTIKYIFDPYILSVVWSETLEEVFQRNGS
jgi:hypothetical protein